ncbi:MAG: hypothetical protein D6781_06800 [Verrucomicrobia bacterium]|nr:MAG: hypothetical protein D6781_06800 [Verrucomicrobiota bacterium]
MAVVYIDGEKVVFDGEPPATLGALTDLLMQVLGQSGRVISAAAADGVAVQELDASRALASFDRVEITTLPQAKAERRLCESVLEVIGPIRARVEELAVEALRKPWPEVVGAFAEAAGTLGAAMENVGALAHIDAVRTAVEAAVAALGRWVEAVHGGEVARLALATKDDLAPALGRLAEVLRAVKEARG